MLKNHENTMGWLAIWVTAFLLTLVIGWFMSANAWAEDTVQLAWDPPTHRVANGDCAQVGETLTPAEVTSLEYTLSYRIKGMGAAWTNVDTIANSAQVTLPGYSVTYEMSVGARFPGGTILCASDLLEYTTRANTNPPGGCSAFTATRVP